MGITSNIGVYMTWTFLPFFSTFLISIPAYFMREEVHSFWFKWMMLGYMPIACVGTFLVARQDGHYVFANGAETIMAIIFFSAGFLLFSVILIIGKYISLRRTK